MDGIWTRKTIWIWHTASFILFVAAGVLVYHYSGSPFFQETIENGLAAKTPGAVTLARLFALLQVVNAAAILSLIGSFVGLAVTGVKDPPRGIETWYTEIHLLGAVTSALIGYLGINEIRYAYLIRSGLDLFSGMVLLSFAWFLMIRFLLCIIFSAARGKLPEQLLICQGIQAVREGFALARDEFKGGTRVVRLFLYQVTNILLSVSTAVLLIIGMYPAGILLLLLLFAVNLWYLIGIAKKTSQQKMIYDRLDRMANGEVGEKLDTQEMTGYVRRMGDTVNRLDDSMELAVSERTKSERMRTELIANVSHDLRTPLTSIINYVDLIRRENIPNPRVGEYLNVLEEKSMRLKTLSEALMEASRAASGNIRLEMVEIDMVQMLRQVYGEFQDQFYEQDLKPVVSMVDPPAVIRADGKILWRVLDNLFTNVIKYAKPGTQVLIDLTETTHSLVFTMKNVSRANLTLTADELTERFVRGDDSRSTEGSGLGLSIAKSMTEQLGGKFDIFPDEEMFRVRIVFPLVLPNTGISGYS